MPRTWQPQRFAAVFLGLLLILQTVGAQEILQSPALYDWGFYGLYPRSWFKTFSVGVPQLNYMHWEETCAEGFYLISPRGSYVSHPGPVILDGRGALVWAPTANFDNAQGITDFKVQVYQGKPHLTFWAGADGRSHRFGMGEYYMLDETYQVVRTVKAVNTRDQSLRGDLHEFHITAQDTALMTMYYPQPADLSSIGGPTEGWVLDSIFQEVDIASGELLFEWRASDHIPVDHTMRSFVGSDLGNTPDEGFDYFHINSVDKDAQGNYLISARHTHQILCISPQGETVWILGGKNNMFTDLSNGRATDFTWQHHARWQQGDHNNKNDSILSLFDNAASTNSGKKYTGRYSRGLVLRIDTQAMTAERLHEYHDPASPKLTESQGSMQVREDTVVLDYGFIPALSEFSAHDDSQVVCDVRFAPWLVWKLGMVTSYRGFKTTEWVGRPWYAPEALLRPADGVLYVSWNGATEVEQWVLQGADWEDVAAASEAEDAWVDLDQQPKLGFEAGFEIAGDDMPRYLRVAALDKDGATLRYSAVIDRTVGNAGADSLLVVKILIAAGVVVGAALMAVVLFWRRGREALRSKCVWVKRCWQRGFTGRRVESSKPEYRELRSYEDEDGGYLDNNK